MIIIGVDPGQTVGAGVRDLLRSPERISGFELHRHDFEDWLRPYLEGCRDHGEEVLVVCERFAITSETLRTNRGDEMWPIEVIGSTRTAARQLGARFVLKGVSDAKKFAPDRLLKTAGWHTPGKGHANDGVRQVVLGCADELKIAPPWV